MFLAAVVCPRWNTITNRQFDRKIDICPFTIMQSAKRNSRDCVADTPVMKSMDCVSRDQYRRMLIIFVLHAIKTKWPFDSTQEKN